jgi:hypothetical protein
MHEKTVFMFAYTVYIFMCLIKEGASTTYCCVPPEEDLTYQLPLKRTLEMYNSSLIQHGLPLYNQTLSRKINYKIN